MNNFADRTDAGRQLAAVLADYADRPSTVVLALPRGGIPVAHEVARMLRLPLDLWIVRKLGVPGHEEVAMGAIASGGREYFDHGLIARLGISQAAVSQVMARE